MSAYHYEGDSLYKANAQKTTNEDGRIHNLKFGLVGPEELDDTNNNQNQEDEKPHIKIDRKPTHFFAEEVT